MSNKYNIAMISYTELFWIIWNFRILRNFHESNAKNVSLLSNCFSYTVANVPPEI